MDCGYVVSFQLLVNGWGKRPDWVRKTARVCWIGMASERWSSNRCRVCEIAAAEDLAKENAERSSAVDRCKKIGPAAEEVQEFDLADVAMVVVVGSVVETGLEADIAER